MGRGLMKRNEPARGLPAWSSKPPSKTAKHVKNVSESVLVMALLALLYSLLGVGTVWGQLF